MPKLFGERLKPNHCPFCGAGLSNPTERPVIRSAHPSTTRFPHHVECLTCGARSADCKESVLAVIKWNQRVDEPPRPGLFPFPRN